MQRAFRGVGVLMLMWASLGTCACDGREPQITLGPLPERPSPRGDDDAGAEIPDGAVLCADAAQCDDGIACTRDLCLAAGYCTHVSEHASCSDGVYCNGTELCDARFGCVSGAALHCEDDDACTVDSCDETAKACVHGVRDFDHDGEVDAHCAGGTDCDDFDETRASRIAEVCGNRIDDDCDDRVDETRCGRAVHDKCDDPLEVSSGGSFELALDGAASDYTFSCDPDASRDVVLTFELSKASDITLIAHGVLGDGSQEIATLALEASCGDASTSRACRRGFPSELHARALAPGRYFVIATSYAARSLLVNVAFAKASKAPTNTRCVTALDVSEGGTFSGDFVEVADSSVGCGPSPSPDLYYALHLDGSRDVELAAHADDGSKVSLALQHGCLAPALQLACDAQAPAQLLLHELPKGDYVVVVSGAPSHEARFALDVAILAPTPKPQGDGCDDPLPLALNTKQKLTLADKQDDTSASCQRFGADAVLRLHVTKRMDLDVTLDAGAALATFALQKECGVPASELACRSGLPMETRLRGLAPGDYFAVIEGVAAGAATIRTQALVPSDPISVDRNESCVSAFDIPAAGGVFVGDTGSLLDDYEVPGCGGGTSSPDAVYRLELKQRKHVIARVDAAFDSVLYRINGDGEGSDPCAGARPDQCDDDSGPGAQAELDEELSAGTYFYVVDGYKLDNAGSYVLDVSVSDP